MVLVWLFILLAGPAPARASAFVYDTGTELLTGADFNGDGVPEILVLDKATGNVRLGYVDTNGIVSWSSPLKSGVENATSLSVGPYLAAGTNCIAVTSPDFNRVNLVSLSDSNTAGAPVVIVPTGVGPHTLVSLSSPPDFSFGSDPALLIASDYNSPSAELLETVQIKSGNPTPLESFPQPGSFERGNTLSLPLLDPADFAAGIIRGTADQFEILQFTNSPGGVAISLSNLPPGSDYVFGIFDDASWPRIILYQSGSTNLNLVSLGTKTGSLAFETNITFSTAKPVDQVFYLSSSISGSGLIQYADGVQSVTLSNGQPVLGPIYQGGQGAAGNVFTGVIPLVGGTFALLDGPAGSPGSTHAQIVQFDGANFTKLSSSSLPPASSRTTRANVWLFQTEPFVNRYPGFIASYGIADWSDSVLSLTPSISVQGETDAGSSVGLGSPSTNSLASTPAGANYALANQYRDAISVFTYASPRPPDAVSITISPSPGIYSGPIQVSFSTLSAGDTVFYRTTTNVTWTSYALPFQITNSGSVQYYGENSSGYRSQVLTANYSIASGVPPVAAYNETNGAPFTNGSGSSSPVTTVNLSKEGSIFYSRVNLSGGSVWAINLDGSSDTYITTGARPRASRDGRYLAFSRGTNVYSVAGGDVWIRDMQTGIEWELFPNQPSIVGYDWDLSSPPNLILDAGCSFYQVSLTGAAAVYPLSHDCNDKAPSVLSLDGSVAFDNLTISSTNLGGLYISPANGGPLQHLLAAGPGARWPAWSPDGKHLSYCLLTSPYQSQANVDIYTINSDGTSPSQISSHTNSVDGFPHGTIWSPLGNALVGAGTINGTNGLWVIPLTPDGQHCDCPARLLPTTAGDPIDFAGSIITTPQVAVPNPGLFIRTTPNAVVVYWSTNYQGFGLESTTSLGTNASWSAVDGPYFVNSGYFEYHESRAELQQTRFFRLVYPTLIYITPSQPTMSVSWQAQSNKVLVTWPTNYAGYHLESTTNLVPPILWSPLLNGTGTVTNGEIEFLKPASAAFGNEFFRLRWP